MIQWLNDNQGFVLGLLTFVYVVATIILVVVTRRNVNLLADIEKSRARPYVVFDVIVEHLVTYTVLKNYGVSPARNVRITVTPELAVPRAAKERKCPTCQHGVAMLAPNREIKSLFCFDSEFFKQYDPPVFHGSVEYYGSDGSLFTEPFQIDLTYSKEQITLGKKDVANEIENLRRSLEQLSRKSSPELVRVIPEDQYRTEFEEDHGIDIRTRKQTRPTMPSSVPVASGAPPAEQEPLPLPRSADG